METYCDLKALVDNPHYPMQRRQCLGALTDDRIDTPIVDVVKGLNKLPYCFTMQSCYGHFLYSGQNDPHNFEPLPNKGEMDKVEYRIAYIAFCIENNPQGRAFFEVLKEMTAIDPDYVQYGCAEWFWKKQVNTYALQVEPERFKHQDTAILTYPEALHVEGVRNTFFVRLSELVKRQRKMTSPLKMP